MSEAQPALPDNDRLEARDWRVLLVWILLGVIGAAVAFKYFFVAFPEASVNFQVSRPVAVETAKNFLEARGENPRGYESTIVFRVDEDAKTYLEREVGLAQANQMMTSQVSVWYWEVRFFRAGQQEEFRVRVSPAGRPVGFEHVLEEARAGAHLERDEARAKCESFLASSGLNLSEYDYLPEEANSTERPKRRDWSFTWERRGFRAPANPSGAPYRLRVTVLGDRVGGSKEFLKVPEQWKRDYDRLRSSNDLYEYLAIVPYVFFYGAMFWLLFELSRRGVVPWRGSLKSGLLLAGLFFLYRVNEWPLTRAGYNTNSSYSGFVVGQFLLAGLISLIVGLQVALTLASAEPLYRRDQPGQLRLLGAAFTWPGVRTKEFFRSCVIGLSMAAAHIGFVVFFYIVGRRLGFWAPQDINYTDVVSTALPWTFPLTIGVYAATNEEFFFRLFAIPFLMRFTRSRFLAVVIPAFVWGFLHSNYPQEPGYVRGIEVGLIGVVAGVVMLRWGILATLVWHYTVDALLISLFLLRSGSLYFKVSGALVGAGALIPLVISGVFYLSRRRFEPAAPLLNAAQPPVESAPEPAVIAGEPVRAGYQALASRTLALLVGVGVLGAALVVAVKPEAIGDFVRFQTDARQAAARADEVLRQRGPDAGSYRRVVTVVDTYDEYANEFLRRQLGVRGANRLYEEQVPSVFWSARYFRDSQKEEYRVILGTDGELHSVHHQLDEKAPGANLTKAEAQARAEAWLREEKKVDLSRWKLVEANSEKRPNRTDHTFTWEQNDAIGQGTEAAHVRVELRVQGDEVSGYRIFVKIPEEWERRQKKETLARTIQAWGQRVLFVALGITVLVLFFKNLRQPATAGLPWRRLAAWSLWGLAAAAVSAVNAFSLILSRYPTEFPFKTFIAIAGISLFMVVIATYSALFFLLGLAWFFLARAFGRERLPGWRNMPAAYYRDAFWVALAGAGVFAGMARLPALVERFWSPVRQAFTAVLPSNLDSYLPAAQAITGAISRGLFTVGLVGLAAGIAAGYLRQRWQQFLLLLVLALTQVGGWGSPGDFARRFVYALVMLGVVWWGIERVARFNLMAYFLLAALFALASAGAPLLRQPNEFFRANGFAVLGALLILLAWPLVAWRRAAAREGRLPGPTG